MVPFLDSRHRPDRLPRFPLQADAVSTLLSTAAFRETLLARIATAERRIYLCALYLQDDEGGAQVLDALYAAKAARPELDVAVWVDWHRAQRGLIGAAPQQGNAAWYRSQAERRGLDVPVYGVPVQTRELFGVLHLKGFVIDDTVLYSGASLNNVYLHVGERYRYDRYHLLTSPALADTMARFLQGLQRHPAVLRLDRAVPSTRDQRPVIRELREALKTARYDLSRADGLPGELGVTPIVGLGKHNPLNQTLRRLIQSAEQRLVLCTPYFNLPTPLLKDITRLLRRGVQVEIIVGDKTANDFFIPPSEPFKTIGALPYLYEASLRRFAKRHQADVADGRLALRLWKDGDHSYHLKGVWVDDDYILVTGNNLNPRAFALDLENALLIHDPRHELTAQRDAELAAIRAHTRVLTRYDELETTRDYPVPVKKLLTRLSRIRLDRLLYKIL